MNKIYVFGILILFVLTAVNAFSQGHIDHIKQMEYMKLKDKVDCNNLPGDNLSERICANLAFQRSDSLLTLIYDSLLLKAKTYFIDSLEYKTTEMQKTWRAFRDQHCSVISDSYKGCGACHMRAIAYLHCLTELTEDRIRELRRLYEEL
jgi:uncharacterized protein YecT (DUF1311 family)